MNFPTTRRRAQAENPIMRISGFKGLNTSVNPNLIDESESPDMLNFMLDERGTLKKRTGYERIYPNSLGEGAVNGLYNFNGLTLIAHGTKLYKLAGGVPVEIYAGMADAPVSFIQYEGKCYMLDGAKMLVYDGTTVAEPMAYIPTITVSTRPEGDGALYEDINLMSDGFSQLFSADGAATEYVLALQGLDATVVLAEVNGETKTEGVDFTVDRTLGKVTFTTQPTKGTNNVQITAFKSFGKKDLILKNARFHIFGGAQDSRFFIYGHPDYPNTIRYSGLEDPTYWPENCFSNVGLDSNAVTGLVNQYDTCVILKDFAFGDALIWSMSFELSSGKASFPVRPINSARGCIAGGSLQVINNAPAFLDRDGVYMLAQSNVRDERNVEDVSVKIANKLLLEPNLSSATSIDYDRKYILAFGSGNAYIFDYQIGAWLLWNNIYASCFMEYNGDLYFGDRRQGLVYRFKRETEREKQIYNDDYQEGDTESSKTIRAYWVSKPLEFGSYEKNKLIKKVHVIMKPDLKTSCAIYTISEDTAQEKNRGRNLCRYDNFSYRHSCYMANIFSDRADLLTVQRADLMSFNTLDYLNFTYSANIFPKELINKAKVKKVLFFQLVLENDRFNESLGVDDISLIYQYQNFRK